jgi:hypothetical protein
MPDKLINLQSEVKRDLELRSQRNINLRVTGITIINEIWNRIESNRAYFEKEIAWIRRMWYFRLHGYWCFIKGKPTYLSPWHFFYLNFWKIEGRIYPEYRDRNRKIELFWHYLRHTKETFKDINKDGDPVLNEDGEYEMIELPFRTFYGPVEPKGRREGISNESQSAQYEETSRTIGAIAAIFSTGEKSASDLFKDKTVKSWQNMPFFFQPNFDGIYDQSKEINFKRPRHTVSGNQLNSRISFAQSAFGIEFDSQRTTFEIFDEEGKTVECDVEERWDTHKQGLATGNGSFIHGFCIHCSTTEDMEAQGGKFFQSIIYDSNFYRRSPITGQTRTGLCTTFLPFYEGMETCIGKFGESIIDDPTPEQIKDGFKFSHGSRRRLQSERDELLRSKNPKDIIKYRRLVVKTPFYLDECFQLSRGSNSFNLEKANRRLAELRRLKEPFRMFNFEWVNGFGGDVMWMPSEHPRFEISHLLFQGEANQKIRLYDIDEVTGEYREMWAPKYPEKYTIGADPTRWKGDKTLLANTGGNQSDGAMVIWEERNKNIDPDDKPIEEYQTDITAGVYRNRILSDIYNEDLLKAAIYFGALVNPETNTGDISQYFIRHGFKGYLFYEVDEATGKQKNKPGFFQSEKTKEEGWLDLQRYMEYYVSREKHSSLIMEVMKLKSFDDLTHQDMAASLLASRRCSRNRGRQLLESVDDAMSDNFMKAWWNNEISV